MTESWEKPSGKKARGEDWRRKGSLWETWKRNAEVKISCCEDQGMQSNLRLDAVLRTKRDKLRKLRVFLSFELWRCIAVYSWLSARMRSRSSQEKPSDEV